MKGTPKMGAFRDTGIALVVWFIAAAFLFSGNLHTDDSGVVAGLLLVLSAAVSFAAKKHGVVLGALLGTSIIASELWNLHANGPRIGMSRPIHFLLLALFLTLIAGVGGLIGQGVRRVIKHRAL